MILNKYRVAFMLLLFAKKNIYAVSMPQIDFKQKKAGGSGSSTAWTETRLTTLLERCFAIRRPSPYLLDAFAAQLLGESLKSRLTTFAGFAVAPYPLIPGERTLYANKYIYQLEIFMIFKQKKAGGFLLTRRNHRFRRDSPTNSPREFVRYRDRLPTPSSGGK